MVDVVSVVIDIWGVHDCSSSEKGDSHANLANESIELPTLAMASICYDLVFPESEAIGRRGSFLI